jgi:hypothetical protein
VSKKWFTASSRFVCVGRLTWLCLLRLWCCCIFCMQGAGFPVHCHRLGRRALCGRLYRLVCRIGSRVGCLQAVFVCCVDMSGRWLCVVWALLFISLKLYANVMLVLIHDVTNSYDWYACSDILFVCSGYGRLFWPHLRVERLRLLKLSALLGRLVVLCLFGYRVVLSCL